VKDFEKIWPGDEAQWYSTCLALRKRYNENIHSSQDEITRTRFYYPECYFLPNALYAFMHYIIYNMHIYNIMFFKKKGY
jgi:hypothetical protein